MKPQPRSPNGNATVALRELEAGTAARLEHLAKCHVKPSSFQSAMPRHRAPRRDPLFALSGEVPVPSGDGSFVNVPSQAIDAFLEGAGTLPSRYVEAADRYWETRECQLCREGLCLFPRAFCYTYRFLAVEVTPRYVTIAPATDAIPDLAECLQSLFAREFRVVLGRGAEVATELLQWEALACWGLYQHRGSGVAPKAPIRTGAE